MKKYNQLWLLLWLCTQFVSSFHYKSISNTVSRLLRLELHEGDENNVEICDSAPFLTALEYAASVTKTRFFYPGHGGSSVPSSFERLFGSELAHHDLPELDELDNIHSSEGPLLTSLKLLSLLYGSKRSWYLLNGSTGGLHIAILSALKHFIMVNRNSKKKPKFLVPRDAHKSVFDALKLAGVGALLLSCDVNNDFEVSMGVNDKTIKDAISNSFEQICGLILTRPNYQGLMMTKDKLTDIISFCHSHKIPVIIDEAHGAHLRFLPSDDIADGLSCGADIVIQSSHKMLNTLTQTGFLHIHPNSFQYHDSTVDIEPIVEKFYSMLTTTSPSAILLSSLDSTVYELYQQYHLNKRKKEETSMYINMQLIEQLRCDLKKLDRNIELLEDNQQIKEGIYCIDPFKLSLRFKDGQRRIDSRDIDDLLCEEYGIYCELNLPSCLTYILTSAMTRKDDSENKYQILLHAIQTLLKSIDLTLLEETTKDSQQYTYTNPERYMVLQGETLFEYFEEERIPLDVSYDEEEHPLLGRISAETICLYPPGIPTIIRGEKIMSSHIRQLQRIQASLQSQSSPSSAISSTLIGSGVTVTGNSDSLLQCIKVYKL